MVMRKSECLNIFSFRFDVDLLIDLYWQVKPLNFILTSAELSEMESITVMAALASHLPGYWSVTNFSSSSFTD
jgi:hypothetical protein